LLAQVDFALRAGNDLSDFRRLLNSRLVLSLGAQETASIVQTPSVVPRLPSLRLASEFPKILKLHCLKSPFARNNDRFINNQNNGFNSQSVWLGLFQSRA
jgi:hypothetical protein